MLRLLPLCCMSGEHAETTLRFVGDWPAWAGSMLALTLGVVAWVLYVRELRAFNPWLRFGLPALRGLAIVMMALLVIGPVLHHRKSIGERGNVYLFVDGSKSMELADRSMDLSRKFVLATELGLLKPGAIDLDL